jgi:Sec-independent protein translocase protein TatA
MLEIEERVNHLDELMARLIQTVDQTSREMREFKEEMRQSHARFTQEMQQSHEDFTHEMQQSHDRFTQEMRQSKRDSDKKWGELSNKLGTMAEDLIAPSVPRILKQVTGCSSKIKYSAVRVRKTEPQNQEFDVVAVCENYVLINETKSTLRTEHIENFHRLMLKIRDYFPEFKENQFIGAIASLYVDETLVRYGEKLGLVVLGFGEELMDVLNSNDFIPKAF